jgi:hypothetical protein
MTLLHDFRTSVAPPAPEVLCAARAAMLTDAAPRRTARPRRLAVFGALAAAGAAAAIAVPALLPSGAGTPRAWAVDRNSNGTVTVTVSHEFRDPTGLQRALNDAGVRAIVSLQTVARDGNFSCQGLVPRLAPGAVQSAVVRVTWSGPQEKVPVPGHPSTSITTSASWIITPSAMPSGDSLYITALVSPSAVDIAAPAVLTPGPAPVCTTAP